MNKVLIITSSSGKTNSWAEREAYVAAFCKGLQAKLKDTQVFYTTYTDMYFWVENQKPVVIDSRNNFRLEEYDFVQFKNWHFELDLAATIANYLDRHAVTFVNSEVKSGLRVNKLSQMFELAFAGLPVPNTYYAYPTSEKFQAVLADKIGYPMIAKANDGSRGDSNYLVNNQAELKAILKKEPDTHFVFQSYIPNDGDYRVLFIGQDREPLVFLRKGDGSSHLNNTSKGGEGQMLKAGALPLVLRQHALAAAVALGRQISGVDIIVNKQTGKHYVLEVNSTPAMATGFAQDKKLAAFAAYLEALVEAGEEE